MRAREKLLEEQKDFRKEEKIGRDQEKRVVEGKRGLNWIWAILKNSGLVMKIDNRIEWGKQRERYNRDKEREKGERKCKERGRTCSESALNKPIEQQKLHFPLSLIETQNGEMILINLRLMAVILL